MGEHSAKVDRLKAVLEYVRTHKGQLTTVAVVAVGLASRYVPNFPGEEVLRVVALLLGVA